MLQDEPRQVKFVTLAAQPAEPETLGVVEKMGDDQMHSPSRSLSELFADLEAEQADLDALLSATKPQDWSRPTPAVGWDVRDSLSHLCFFEEAAVASLSDPARFVAQRDELYASMASSLQPGSATPDVALGRQIGDPVALLERWRTARASYADAAASADPKVRVEWYGPSMSLASFTTARLMEAWAHGVDIKDAVGVALVASRRLRHICHIGFSARAYSFASHGVDDPGDPVRLVVESPDGDVWTWGPADATDVISGPALDVALVFTQRRHRSRTLVRTQGPTAELWLSIAQAFAGPGTVTDRQR